MNIIVCMKQVPASSKIEVDQQNGTLKRLGAETKTNPYDLFALETALKIKEMVGGKITVLTMGPMQTKAMIFDAFSMGADEGVILSDKKFAGSDVLATSYTLSQGILLLKDYDLIICGKQTTDGDTAQIGPAIAEHLLLPHIAWANAICGADNEKISVRHEFDGITQVSEMHYPCLITVDKDIFVPRLPSYRLKWAAKDKDIRIISYDELPGKDLSRYGLVGSPTSVERIFEPEVKDTHIYINGNEEEAAEQVFEVLLKEKFIS